MSPWGCFWKRTALELAGWVNGLLDKLTQAVLCCWPPLADIRSPWWQGRSCVWAKQHRLPFTKVSWTIWNPWLLNLRVTGTRAELWGTWNGTLTLGAQNGGKLTVLGCFHHRRGGALHGRVWLCLAWVLASTPLQGLTECWVHWPGSLCSSVDPGVHFTQQEDRWSLR